MAARRHNLTRRALLGVVAGVPVLLGDGVAPALGVGGARAADPRRSWERALAAFRSAEARLAAHRAYEAGLPAILRAFPACEPLEDRFDDLECARLAALRRLLRVPAADLRTLSLKVDLVVDEDVASLTGGERCLAVLKADARRLAYGR